jgi:4-amino-4-deoxy-L-arabinose transferase-like glycosyltransferase
VSTIGIEPPVSARRPSLPARGRAGLDARAAEWLAVGATLVLAGVLRLWTIHDVPGNVFYDAAVRSMGQSWHALFFGALDPGASLAIDKPPVDLWLQVAATKALGFTSVALHLPEALAGVAACGLLYGALRRPFGAGAALLAALALAVLPLSVLTARSDTMDSLLAALQVAALWLSWQALHSRQPRWSVLAAATMGVAFNVKLAEALIAMPALALLWLWAAPRGARLRTVAATAATFLVVALSWTAIASLTPLRDRPFPVGSSNGSIWRVTLVYNGLNRIAGTGASAAPASFVGGAPGPLRLFSTAASSFWTLIGAGLLAALLLGAAALGRQSRERLRVALQSPRGRYALGILLWLLVGLILFSAVRRLQTRYLEAIAPPLCAVLGVSLSVLLYRVRRWQRLGLALLALGLLAVALGSDVKLIRKAHTDSLLTDHSSPALSRYLRANRGGAYYEAASANVNDITGLIVRDGLPVLVLNDVDGALTRVAPLQAAVTQGRVHFYFAPHECHRGAHCPTNEVWAYAHSTPVVHLPGLRRFALG